MKPEWCLESPRAQPTIGEAYKDRGAGLWKTRHVPGFVGEKKVCMFERHMQVKDSSFATYQLRDIRPRIVSF